MGILSGYTILDLTTVVLGPFATQMLGDLGAEIIKVEPPEGDIMRHAGPMRSPGMGPIYLTINRNKRAVTLDLRKDPAKDILRRLVSRSDVLIHNVRAAGMARLGFDYEAAKAIRPDIVYVHAVGFASNGHYAGRQAYDDLVQASSGLATLLPRQDGSDAPRYFPGLIADKTTGVFAANAVLAGLLHRERTGEGQFIEVPMLECMVAFNMAENLYGHSFVPPMGPTAYTRSMSIHRKPYRTRDGYLAILPYSNDNWREFFRIAGRPELASDKRFATYAERTRNIDEIYRIASELSLLKTSAEWFDELTAANVPCMPVHSLDSILDDPQMRETGFVSEREHPTEGRYLAIGHPIRYGAQPARIERDPPRPGQDTLAVLRELGLGEDEIRAAGDAGAFGEAKDATGVSAG